MELMGALLRAAQSAEPRVQQGDTRFSHRWRCFLERAHPEYRRVKGGPKFVRTLARDPLAHTFLTAPGITFVKDYRFALQPDGPTFEHLDYVPDNAGNPTLVLDCARFARDFKDSYDTLVIPILHGNADSYWSKVPRTRATMQARLNEMINGYVAMMEREIERAENEYARMLARSSPIDTAPTQSPIDDTEPAGPGTGNSSWPGNI
jgi:hypothetical protein